MEGIGPIHLLHVVRTIENGELKNWGGGARNVIGCEKKKNVNPRELDKERTLLQGSPWKEEISHDLPIAKGGGLNF